MRFLWIVLIAFHLQAALGDHLKKAEGKWDVCWMRNIDFVYIINLDQRPEKFERSAQQLALWGIFPYRFSAVNGWELPLDVINDVGVCFQPWMSTGAWGTYYEDQDAVHEFVYKQGRTYFCHCMSRGAIGIVLSHLSVLQDAYDSGYETIWVMEDDIDVLQNPHLLSELVARLDKAVGREGWDILFTDIDTKNTLGQYVPCTGFAWRPNYHPLNTARFAEQKNIDADFRQVGARFGAYSMIVRRSGMEKILKFFKEYHIFLPFDIEYPYPEDIRLFTVQKDIVSHWVGAPSDNGAPNYQRIMK